MVSQSIARTSWLCICIIQVYELTLCIHVANIKQDMRFCRVMLYMYKEATTFTCTVVDCQ